MHILIEINEKLHEWQNSTGQDTNNPRMPLPHAFGIGFHKRGHKLSAINFSSSSIKIDKIGPFERIYSRGSLFQAMRQTDLIFFWGANAIRAVLGQLFLKKTNPRILFGAYVWEPKTPLTLKNRVLSIATHMVAPYAKALVLQTATQCKIAKKTLSNSVPILKITIGVDTKFYGLTSTIKNVPGDYRPYVEKLLDYPYVIMPGDQQRFDNQALDIVAGSNLRLVRVLQMSNTANWLKQQVKRRNLSDRFFIFENINYPFFRFLLQHASCYAGLVDSTWQPAGWTVACEALASGIPLVLYEGLVSQELELLSAGKFLHSIPLKNTEAFKKTLEEITSKKPDLETVRAAQAFAAEKLDLEKNSENFVKKVENL